MYSVFIQEECGWPPNSGRFINKQHNVKTTIRARFSQIPDIETYQFISEEQLPRQLKTISVFKQAKSVLIKDSQSEYQLWSLCEESLKFVRVIDDEVGAVAWCILKLGGQLIREYLSSFFYCSDYNITQLGFSDFCEIQNPPKVSSQFNISTKPSNRWNLNGIVNRIENKGSMLNSDNVIREYDVNVYNQSYNLVKADASLFIYLPINKILDASTIYDVTALIEAYDEFNRIPPYKSEGIKS